MSAALIGGGLFILVLVLIVVAVLMNSQGGDSPAPSATTEEEPATAVEKSKDMIADAASVPTEEEPTAESKDIQKVEVEKDTPKTTPDKMSGLVGWYDAESWDKKANEWKDKSGKNNHVTEVKGEPDVDEDGGVKFVFGGKKVGMRFPQEVMRRGKKYTLFHVTKYNGEARGRIFDGIDSNYLSGFWAGRTGGVAHRDGTGWITHYNSEKDDKWVLSTDTKNIYRKNGLQRSGFTNNRGVIPSRVTINFGQFTHGEKKPDSAVTIYKHCGYGGRSVSRTSGSYDMDNIGMRNDDVSSVRVPKGMEIEIYEHAGFKGKSKKFTSDDDCFVNDGFNDIMSSYVIRNTSEGGLGPESSDWAVAEVIFFDRELSIEEMQQIETYLHLKYKIRKDIRSEIWTPSFVKSRPTAVGEMKDLDGMGMTCGTEGVLRSTRLHSHGGSNSKHGNRNFQYEGSCIQGGVEGTPTERTSSYVDATSADWFSKYKELVDGITCRESAIAAYQFESSKDGSKLRAKHSCNGRINEESCRDVVARQHRHNHNPHRLTNDGLFSAMHYQDLDCGIGQTLTKMKLEKNDKGGVQLRGTCCALEDI